MFADEGIGIAAADHGQKQEGVGFCGELVGRAWKEDNGGIGALPDPRCHNIHGPFGDQAASEQHGVNGLKSGS